MEELNINSNEPVVYKKLPKEQKKALEKEYAETPEAKKANRIFIIIAVVCGVASVASAVAGFFVNGLLSGTPAFPVYLVIYIALYQNKYEKWLTAEKNIIMKKPKNKE